MSIFLLSGSGLLAALQIERNVVAVEKDRWQFMHSQMRAVSALSESTPAEVASSPETPEVSPTVEDRETNNDQNKETV